MSGRTAQSGFSLVEMLVVLSILGLLVRVSIPVYQNIRYDALATRVSADFNTVRAAAIAQYEATGRYAPDGPAGAVPEGMRPFLPRQFTFEKRDYRLDWENWTITDPGVSADGEGQVLALTVVSPDERLGRRVAAILGANCSHWTVGDANTFVILSTLEAGR